MDITDKFYLRCLSSAISGKKIESIPNGIDFKRLFNTANRHSETVLVYCALKDLFGDVPKFFVSALIKSFNRQTALDIRSEYDKKTVIEKLKENKIKFMPLKGYFLKQMYPESVMRYASDCDILLDKDGIKSVKQIMEDLGYKKLKNSEHHDVYYNPNTMTIFEFHKRIFVGALEKYFGTGFERAEKVAGEEYLYNLNPNDYYMSIISHYAFHFDSSAGIGMRAIVDIKVMEDYFKDKLDFKYIDTELKKISLYDFNAELKKVVSFVFEGKKGSEFTEKLTCYILKSSFLSNDENFSANFTINNDNSNTNKSKIVAIKKTIFPSKESIYFTYPFIDRHKYLLFLGYFIRTCRILLLTPKHLLKIKDISNVKEENYNEIYEIKKELGLKNIAKLI